MSCCRNFCNILCLVTSCAMNRLRTCFCTCWFTIYSKIWLPIMSKSWNHCCIFRTASTCTNLYTSSLTSCSNLCLPFTKLMFSMCYIHFICNITCFNAEATYHLRCDFNTLRCFHHLPCIIITCPACCLCICTTEIVKVILCTFYDSRNRVTTVFLSENNMFLIREHSYILTIDVHIFIVVSLQECFPIFNFQCPKILQAAFIMNICAHHRQTFRTFVELVLIALYDVTSLLNKIFTCCDRIRYFYQRQQIISVLYIRFFAKSCFIIWCFCHCKGLTQIDVYFLYSHISHMCCMFLRELIDQCKYLVLFIYFFWIIAPYTLHTANCLNISTTWNVIEILSANISNSTIICITIAMFVLRFITNDVVPAVICIQDLMTFVHKILWFSHIISPPASCPIRNNEILIKSTIAICTVVIDTIIEAHRLHTSCLDLCGQIIDILYKLVIVARSLQLLPTAC